MDFGSFIANSNDDVAVSDFSGHHKLVPEPGTRTRTRFRESVSYGVQWNVSV